MNMRSGEIVIEKGKVYVTYDLRNAEEIVNLNLITSPRDDSTLLSVLYKVKEEEDSLFPIGVDELTIMLPKFINKKYKLVNYTLKNSVLDVELDLI